jgi:hypothetical protein
MRDGSPFDIRRRKSQRIRTLWNHVSAAVQLHAPQRRPEATSRRHTLLSSARRDAVTNPAGTTDPPTTGKRRLSPSTYSSSNPDRQSRVQICAILAFVSVCPLYSFLFIRKDGTGQTDLMCSIGGDKKLLTECLQPHASRE